MVYFCFYNYTTIYFVQFCTSAGQNNIYNYNYEVTPKTNLGAQLRAQHLTQGKSI